MTSITLENAAIYLLIGYCVAFIVNQSIIRNKLVEPYTGREIGIAILFWPIIAIGFIYGIIRSFFNNESN